MTHPQRIIYVVTEDWYFLSHRLPMARAARDAGFEVHVATRIGNNSETVHALLQEGFIIHPVPFERGSLSLLTIFKTIWALYSLFGKIRPHIVHNVAVTPCILGGIAGIFYPKTAMIQAITGLGSLFLGRGLKAKLLQVLARYTLKFTAQLPKTQFLVQNEDDADFITNLWIPAARIHLIYGSGIDSTKFTPQPEPSSPPFVITYVGRMLYDKGIADLVSAFDILHTQNFPAKLILAGTIDPANIASLSQEQLNSYALKPNIECAGHVRAIADLWAKSHIAILPSKREGFPKSLLEAAACGRPMIATDVPGCRALVKHEYNGLLVAPESPEALAHAIMHLCNHPDLRTQYGLAARYDVEHGLDDISIGNQIVTLYKNTLASTMSAS